MNGSHLGVTWSHLGVTGSHLSDWESLMSRIGISLFLAGSGVQNFWANGVQNSCAKVPLVKCNGNSEYMEKWEKYVAYT